jgi:hypothetical protein
MRSAARKLECAARRDPAFAGVSLNEAARELSLFRAGGSAGLSAEFMMSLRCVLPAGVELVVRNAVLSRAHIIVLDDVVERYRADCERVGLTLQAWGMLDGWDSPYVVEYSGSGSFPDDARRAMNRFGTGTAIMRRGETVTLR